MKIITERRGKPKQQGVGYTYDQVAEHSLASEWETYFAGVVGPVHDLISFSRVSNTHRQTQYEIERISTGRAAYRVTIQG